jgi:Domain of unknown function (DUF2431)
MMMMMMNNNQTSKRRQRRRRQEATTTATTGDIGSLRNSGNQHQQQQQQQHDDDHDEDYNNNNNNNNKNISIRDVSQLYCSAVTLYCARKHYCISCAYKIACFDVARDIFFCQTIPNQRPETCPRINNNNNIHNIHHIHHQYQNHHHDDDDDDDVSSCAINKKSTNPAAAAAAERVGVVAEIGTLGYQPHYRILTIGDGDFSYSLALALMLQQQQRSTAGNKDGASNQDASGLTATSFESKETLEQVYGPDMMTQRIQLLESMNVRILYQVDGTKLTPEVFFTQQQQQQQQQQQCSFHRIIWNFPCSAIQKGQDGQNQEMDFNKALIRNFVTGAVPLLDNDNGQIHINHKTKVNVHIYYYTCIYKQTTATKSLVALLVFVLLILSDQIAHFFFCLLSHQSTIFPKPPFNQWQIQDVALAAMSSLDNDDNDDKQQSQQHRVVYYWGRVVLDRALFPPYIPRKALHSKSFPIHDACTYIFGHCNNSSNNNASNVASPRGLDTDVVHLDLDDNDDFINNDDILTVSAATLVPVTRPLILSLRRHLLQYIMPSLDKKKNATSISKRNKKKRRRAS